MLSLLQDYSLKGKLVKSQRGPATVNGSNLYIVTVEGREDIGCDEHEPGNLPVFLHKNLRG